MESADRPRVRTLHAGRPGWLNAPEDGRVLQSNSERAAAAHVEPHRAGVGGQGAGDWMEQGTSTCSAAGMKFYRFTQVLILEEDLILLSVELGNGHTLFRGYNNPQLKL